MDYKERVLRVTAFNLTPWVSVEPEPYFTSINSSLRYEEHLPFYGPLFSFLEYLRDSLNFRIKFVAHINASQGHGKPGPNNSEWNGAIGMIRRNEVDLALVPAGLSLDRFQATFMPLPLAYTDTSILSRHTSPQPDSAMYFLTMFPIEVWTIIAISGFFVSTFTYACEQKLPNRKITKKQKSRSHGEYVWQIFATLFSEYISIPIRTSQSRALVSCWLLLTVVVISVINGSKKATLMTNFESNIETLNDIYKLPNLAPIMMKNSIFTRYFKMGFTSAEETLVRRTIYERAEKRKTLVTPDAIASQETYHQVFNRRVVILNDYYQTIRGLVSFCSDDKVGEFYISHKKFYEISASLLFTRNLLDLSEDITLRVLRVKETGLMDYWMLGTLGNNYEKCLDNGGQREENSFYGITELSPVFSTALKGYILGFIIIAIEIGVYQHYKGKIKNIQDMQNETKPIMVVTNTGNSDPSNSGNSDPSNSGNSSVTFTGNNNDTFTGNNNDTFTGNNNDTFTGNNNDTFTGNNNDTFTGNNNDTFTGNNSDTFTGNNSDTFTGNNSDTFSENINDTFTGKNNDTFTGNNNDTFTENINDTFTENINDTFTGNSNVSSNSYVANIGKSSVANIRKSTVTNIGKSTVTNIGKSTVTNIGKSTITNIGKSTITNIGKSTITNIGKSSVTNIGKSTGNRNRVDINKSKKILNKPEVGARANRDRVSSIKKQLC